MTAQEIFDHCWNWLVVQNNPKCANAKGECLYRGKNGRTCVIGSLVTDLECEGWDALGESGILDVPNLPERFAEHLDLLAEIQGVHDQSDLPGTSRRDLRMRAIARDYNLEIPSA